MSSRYAAWLRSRNVPVHEAAGTEWRVYHSALMPVNDLPVDALLAPDEAKGLLRESGAAFLRFSSRPQSDPTEWWYALCDRFLSLEELSKRARYDCRRGMRSCSVRPVAAEWLADHGYECYRAAHGRYRHAQPVDEATFGKDILDAADGPFEFWGGFVDGNLAGYTKCIVEATHVYNSVSKYHPTYLKDCITAAMVRHIAEHYVAGRGLIVMHGTRTLVHETNYQESLVRLGSRRQYCQLNVVYRPWLKTSVSALFRLRGLVNVLPRIGPVPAACSLMAMELIRRSTLAAPPRPDTRPAALGEPVMRA